MNQKNENDQYGIYLYGYRENFTQKIRNDRDKSKVKKEISILRNYPEIVPYIMGKGYDALKEKNWEEAEKIFDDVIELRFDFAPAYIGKLCSEVEVIDESQLAFLTRPIHHYFTYLCAYWYGDTNCRLRLDSYCESIEKNIENEIKKLREDIPKKHLLVDKVRFSQADWIILDKQENEVLLLRWDIAFNEAYSYDEDFEYYYEYSRINWFLNSCWYNTFSDTQKALIKTIYYEMYLPSLIDKSWKYYEIDRTYSLEEVEKIETKKRFKLKKEKLNSDTLFSLSIEEVIKYFGDSGKQVKYEDNSIIRSDQYNANRIAYSLDGKPVHWWLRSMGYDPEYATMIGVNGEIWDVKVQMLGFTCAGIRPAMWLNLDPDGQNHKSPYIDINDMQIKISCRQCDGLLTDFFGLLTCLKCGFELDKKELLLKIHENKHRGKQNEYENLWIPMIMGNSALKRSIWSEAASYFNMALAYKADYYKASLGKLCAYLQLPSVDELDVYLGHLSDEEYKSVTTRFTRETNGKILEDFVTPLYYFGNRKWVILEKQKDKMLLLCKEVLTDRSYHNCNDYITWEKCDMRKFLNTDFYNTFSKEEQARIIETTLKNEKNPLYKTKGGRDTRDKIFLLSVSETFQYFGNKDRSLTDSIEAETIPLSGFFNGCIDLPIEKEDGIDIDRVWLRTPGFSQDDGCLVYVDDKIYLGYNGNFWTNGYCPAMWITR